jgi:CMP-N,N'-diacetyllegionaminic acid synthase
MYCGKKILAVIPARGGSKGIKLKNLKKVKGLTLVEHVAKIIVQNRKIDYAYVSTDSNEIKKNALNTGILKALHRPKNLSGDRVSDLDVLSHAIEELKKKINFDIILMLQPTSVLRKSSHINKALKLLINKKYDAVWSVSKVDHKYHPLKQLKIKKDKLNFFEEGGKKIISRQQLENTYIRNGAVYAFKKKIILNDKRILNSKTGFFVIKEQQISIDDYNDLRKARELLKK